MLFRSNRSHCASQISKEEIHFNAATMRPVTLNTIPHKSYTFKGGSTLIDGLYGDMNYRSGRWIGFYGTDMNVTLDLLEPKEVYNGDCTSGTLPSNV